MNARGVVHLCSSLAHAGLAMAACARAMTSRDLCVVIDDARGVARARALGLIVDAHIAPAMRRPAMASRALRHLLRETDCDQRTLVAWGSHLEPLVTATSGEQIVVDFDRGMIERFPGSLRGPGPIRTLGAPDAPLCEPLGADARAAWRSRMSLSPEDRAVALAGIDASECDVPDFVHVLGMLHFAKVPVVGVVDRAQMSRHRAAIRRAREAMPDLRVLLRDEPMLAWIGACDAAVLSPGDRFDSGPTSRRFDAPLLAASIAHAGVAVIVAERDAGEASDPRVVRVESAHPAVMARALRQSLESAPSDGSAGDRQLAAHAWRRALAAVADPPAVGAIAGATA